MSSFFRLWLLLLQYTFDCFQNFLFQAMNLNINKIKYQHNYINNNSNNYNKSFINSS